MLWVQYLRRESSIVWCEGGLDALFIKDFNNKVLFQDLLIKIFNFFNKNQRQVFL